MLGVGHGMLARENPTEMSHAISALVLRWGVISKFIAHVIGNMTDITGIADSDGVAFEHLIKA